MAKHQKLTKQNYHPLTSLKHNFESIFVIIIITATHALEFINICHVVSSQFSIHYYTYVFVYVRTRIPKFDKIRTYTQKKLSKQ